MAWLTVCMTPEVDPGRLSDAEKDALMLALALRPWRSGSRN